MSDYQPKTLSIEELREHYARSYFGPSEHDYADFDASMKAHDARIASEAAEVALQDAADDWHLENAGTSPRMHTWLRARADRLAAEREDRS